MVVVDTLGDFTVRDKAVTAHGLVHCRGYRTAKGRQVSLQVADSVKSVKEDSIVDVVDL